MSSFHEVRFPVRLAFGSGSGIERKTEIVSLASGYERRISPWALGRRCYLIGAGVRSLVDAAELLGFFEAREGRLYGFRFKDFADFKSCALNAAVSATDQVIGTGDGVTTAFQLVKVYGGVTRDITKPVSGTVKVAVEGIEVSFGVNETTGIVTLASAPAVGKVVTAGFEFDTPVRFDSERIDLTLEGVDAGRLTAVSLIEIRV
ncbi:phage distal tail protein, Rcc01695 family [Asticcacaulis taihuensis]|uniref:phage distal tail protein, Rcc01695 family n=1 Tax=Asticcacaulis taihuensis TaxID=260084 RepID=UPI003F7C0A78